MPCALGPRSKTAVGKIPDRESQGASGYNRGLPCPSPSSTPKESPQLGGNDCGCRGGWRETNQRPLRSLDHCRSIPRTCPGDYHGAARVRTERPICPRRGAGGDQRESEGDVGGVRAGHPLHPTVPNFVPSLDQKWAHFVALSSSTPINAPFKCG